MQFLITGAAGHVGGLLCKRMLDDGHSVVAAARGDQAASAGARVIRTLGPDARVSNLEVVEWDITRADALPLHLIRTHWGEIDAVVHTAAFLKYDWRHEAQAMQTNVEGTRNVLALAHVLRAPFFADLSTAYVGAGRATFRECDIGRPADAHNAYERTKMLAEQEVRAWRDDECAIIRPSTIIGDSRTGEVPAFTGLYGFIKPVWQMREMLRKFRDDPIRIPVNPASTLNLVPQDWVVDMICAILYRRLAGTYHLTHPTPVSMRWLFQAASRALDLPVVYDPLPAAPDTAGDRGRLQEMVLQGTVRLFDRYVKEDTVFGHNAIRTVPGYRPPPVIDEPMLGRMLAYARQRDFGRKTEKPLKVCGT